MITDVGIDPAGNVWAANNWNDLKAVVSKNPAGPISTKAVDRAWWSSMASPPR